MNPYELTHGDPTATGGKAEMIKDVVQASAVKIVGLAAGSFIGRLQPEIGLFLVLIGIPATEIARRQPALVENDTYQLLFDFGESFAAGIGVSALTTMRQTGAERPKFKDIAREFGAALQASWPFSLLKKSEELPEATGTEEAPQSKGVVEDYNAVMQNLLTGY